MLRKLMRLRLLLRQRLERGNGRYRQMGGHIAVQRTETGCDSRLGRLRMRGLHVILRLRLIVVWKHDVTQLDGDGSASSHVETTDSVAIPWQWKLQTQQIREK